MFKLLNKNKRIILTEKFSVPRWFDCFLKLEPQYLHNNSSEETYRIILRVLNGDDITITTSTRGVVNECAVEVNKWRKNPEKIDYQIACLLLYWELIGLDSGNFETGEEHYNIFAK